MEAAGYVLQDNPYIHKGTGTEVSGGRIYKRGTSKGARVIKMDDNDVFRLWAGNKEDDTLEKLADANTYADAANIFQNYFSGK